MSNDNVLSPAIIRAYLGADYLNHITERDAFVETLLSHQALRTQLELAQANSNRLQDWVHDLQAGKEWEETK